MSRICPSCAGFALGLVWGIYLLLLGMGAAFVDYGTEVVALLGKFYLGYQATLVGCAVGFIWGVLDGFIFGFLAAFFYNLFNKKCSCSKEQQ